MNAFTQFVEAFENWFHSFTSSNTTSSGRNKGCQTSVSLHSFIWHIGPLVMTLPGLWLRMRDSVFRKPFFDIVTVYAENVSFLLLIIFALKLIIPRESHLWPQHLRQDWLDRKEYDPLLPTNSKNGVNRTKNRHSTLLGSVLMILVVSTFLSLVVSDYLYQIEVGTVVDVQVMDYAQGMAESGNTISESLKMISNPYMAVIPFAMVLSALYSMVVFAGNNRDRSVISVCAKSKNSGRLSIGFLLLAVGLVLKTKSYSPCANFIAVNIKLKVQTMCNSFHEFDRSDEELAYMRKIKVHSAALRKHQKVMARFGRRRPNVVFIVSESLTGYAQNSPSGRENMPFFHNKLSKMEGFVDFKNSRATSSLTQIAKNALLSGLQPIGNEAAEAVKHALLGLRFLNAGYETAVFSADKIKHSNEAWEVMNDNKAVGFETLVDIASLNARVANCCAAMDDRLLLDEVEKWLQNFDGQAKKKEKDAKPFMLNLFTNSLHPGYIVPDDFKTDGVGSDLWKSRYLAALQVHDDLIRRVFDKLYETGILDNTIVIAGSDHGDMPANMKARAHGGSPVLLSNAVWTYVGKNALMNEERYNYVMDNLESNSHKVVSSVDVVPTLMSLVGVPESDLYSKYERENFVHGESLAEKKLSPHRIIYAWQGEPWTGNLFGAMFFGSKQGLFFSNRPQLAGIVEFPETSDEYPHEDPFPELEINRPRSRLLKFYTDHLQRAPNSFRDKVIQRFGKNLKRT